MSQGKHKKKNKLERWADEHITKGKPEEFTACAEYAAVNDIDPGFAEDNTGLLVLDNALSTETSGNADDFLESHQSKSRKGLWIALGCVFCVLLLAYFGTSLFFVSHFGFNTVINDVDCSFKTVTEVEDVIKAQVADYQLEIIESDGTSEFIDGSDIDLTYVSDDQVETLLDNQNFFAWFMRIFDTQADNSLHASVDLDESQLKKAIDNLDFMDADDMVAPVDAYAEFDGTQYVVHPEEPGTTIDTAVIYSAIEDAIVNTVASIDLDAAGCYVKPAVTSTTEDLLSTIDLYNQQTPFTLTYTFGETKEVLDATTMYSWLIFAEDGSTTLDEDAIATWVADFASRHDTVGTTREFTSITGATATISGGTYGWEVDQDAEVEAIEQMFSDKQSQTRDPYYISTASSYENPDWGNTYIELSISSQHMYYIVDGKIAFESDVVTGRPSAGHSTPKGVWSILEMQQNKILRGALLADGTYEYESPVAYWMRVTWTGVGFHDATWQSSFGGTRYLTNGSHGCINMPYSAAQTLYSLLAVGTPVVIYD